MDSLKQYLEIQQTELVILKDEILLMLEELIHPLDHDMLTPTKNSTRHSHYMSELCQFQQKKNHKLTEIKFELKKFIKQHKCPKSHPPVEKEIPTDQHLDDIETLKLNTSKLISKLDQLSIKHAHDIDDVKTVTKIENQEPDHLISFDSNSSSPTTTYSENPETVRGIKSENLSLIDCDINLQNIYEKTDVPNFSTTKDIKVTESENTPSKRQEKKKIENSFEGNVILENSKCDSFSLEKTEKPDQINQLGVENSTDCHISNSTPLREVIDNTNNKIDLLLSECFWKNIRELSSTQIEDCEVFEDVDAENNSSPQNIQTIPCEEDQNICDDNKIAANLNFQNTPETQDGTCSSFSISDSEDFQSYNSCQEFEDDSEKDLKIEQKVSNKDPVENLSNKITETVREEILGDSNTKIEESQGEKMVRFQLEEKIVTFEDSANRAERFNRILNQFKSSNNVVIDEDKRDTEKEIEALLNKNKRIGQIEQSLEQSGISKKSENTRPIFSAEQKIEKLGLEDRMTIFERTRAVAKLPDLSLKPRKSIPTDNGKAKKKKKMEIADCIELKRGMVCRFSHVESPSEFYLHPGIEEAKYIDQFNDLITEHYKHTSSPYSSKKEASDHIEQFCCAYVKEDKIFYRVEIVDWMEKSEKLVIVQTVDYGDYKFVHFKGLRPITSEFCLIPRLAIRCYFPLLYPPGSTRNNLLTNWPHLSIETLFDLAGLTKNEGASFRLVHVEKDGYNDTAVDLIEVNGRYSDTIGQLLIDLAHAVQIILPEDDPLGVLKDEEDIEKLEKCDNLNEVILGYDPKDEARICKFTTKEGGRCYKKGCKLEHTVFKRGGFTTDTVPTFTNAVNSLKLPRTNDYTAIRFTTLSGNRFYGNLSSCLRDLNRLEVIMNDLSNCRKFERFKILPAHGEVVIVNHWHVRWVRGRVRHHNFNEDGDCIGVQVFMVDYGDIIDVTLDNIRQMREEYMILPFQAVEFVIANYRRKTDFSHNEMDKFFYENMVFRIFPAKVLAVSDMQLSLEMFYKDRKLGDVLSDYGVFEKVKSQLIQPHPDSIIIPG